MNICATDIKMEIGNNEILKGVSIDSKNKEFVGIIGPNGSGKSTLLKCIYRTLKWRMYNVRKYTYIYNECKRVC